MNDAVNDPELLESLYWGEGLSMWRIAERLGVSETAVYTRMVEYNIDRRGTGYNSRSPRDNHDGYKKSVSFRTSKRGYEVWSTKRDVDGKESARVHRLVLVADGEDPHEVYAEGKQCHHKNGIPWDNRAENLELLTPQEHGKLHADQRDGDYYRTIGGNEEYTNEEMLEWLDTAVELLGRVPYRTDLNDEEWPGPSPETYSDRFGSWRSAVREAGYKPIDGSGSRNHGRMVSGGDQ